MSAALDRAVAAFTLVEHERLKLVRAEEQLDRRAAAVPDDERPAYAAATEQVAAKYGAWIAAVDARRQARTSPPTPA